MPQTTYPNQRLVRVHKADLDNNFLGVNNDVWMTACRDLGYPATVLYLYLAANKDNYQLALSPAAIQMALGMPRTTYRDQIRNLISKGYLVERGGNRYDFYEIPQRDTALINIQRAATATVPCYEECAFVVDEDALCIDPRTGEIIEINNKLNESNREVIDKAPFNFKEPIVASEKIERTWSISDF